MLLFSKSSAMSTDFFLYLMNVEGFFAKNSIFTARSRMRCLFDEMVISIRQIHKNVKHLSRILACAMRRFSQKNISGL